MLRFISLLPLYLGSAEVIDRVAAVIEDDIVTVRELEEQARPYLAQLEDIEDPVERDKRRKAILRQVLDIQIGERIVRREIEQQEERLGVTSKDVDKAIDEVLRQNNITRDQLQAALYGQGMTWSEYRQKLKEQIERARLIQFKVQGKVQVRDQDARQLCAQRRGTAAEQLCASHILFALPKGASEAEVEKIRARASQLQAELAQGADFSAYALKYSQDTSAADGDIGCFGRGDMVDEFEKIAFATPVGGISPVVRTEFGLHIIKVRERKHAATPCDSDEALAPFKNELYQKELERQMEAWIQELRRRAFVQVRI